MTYSNFLKLLYSKLSTKELNKQTSIVLNYVYKYMRYLIFESILDREIERI